MQPGTLVAGKYRVERIIGRGGMGLVVEATHVHLGTHVALKFLAEEMASEQTAVARFNREARASAQLKSEHICHVSDFGIEANVPYIVMDLLVGTDLARLSKVRTLDVNTAALYIKQACIGLSEAHAAGIVHRDLKPGNLFLTRRNDGSPLIKVLDFGVAKAPLGENEVKLTGTSNVVGSPGFMSPEQFRSSKSVDARTDIWALGVILYKLVSGKLPFKADGFAEFALAISRDPMPPLSGVPPEFEAIVSRCLEKDPAKRFPDVMALADALTPFADKARPSAPVLATPERPPTDANEVASGIGSMPPPSAPGQQTRVSGSKEPAAKPPAKTVLGVSIADEAKPPMNMRPTAQGTAIPMSTMAGTGTPVIVPGGDLLPGTVVGEYRIESKIGQGGMGAVYGAMHPLIGKRAAVKVIAAELGTDPQLVQRFVQEARSVNQIGHPNIVDVFAFGQLPDGRNYFVMEYLQGQSLRDKLTHMFIPLAEAVQILDEIASALEAAHEKGIVHRDLKPDNVYLASVRGGFIMVKLLDFGIAKLVAGDGGIAKTSTGMMMGTPGYISPEQVRGKNVDYRTDIYALGCMMYEMVTGRLPFIAESPMDIIAMHVSAPVQKPSELKPDIPPLLEQLILQMLEKDPERRPSLAQIRDGFAELVASGMVLLEPGSGATFRSDLRRRGDNEARTPTNARNPMRAQSPVPSAPIVPSPSGAQTTARRRSASPSDAPTGIAFTPSSQTLTPSDKQPTLLAPGSAPPVKKKRGVAIAVISAALLIPIVGIGVVLATRDGEKTPEASTAGSAGSAEVMAGSAQPADAAIAQQPVDAGVEDATVAEVTPDAAVEPVAQDTKPHTKRGGKKSPKTTPPPTGTGTGSGKGSSHKPDDAPIDPFQ